MKKFLGFFAAAMLGLAACEGPMGPPGRDGRDAESMQWHVEDFDVLTTQWRERTEEGDGYFFYYFEHEIRLPELTEFVFNNGFVGAYLVMEIVRDGRRQLVQRPLPYTIYGMDGDIPYSENYSFETRPGWIRFIVKYSDFSEMKPLTCTFLVVMMW